MRYRMNASNEESRSTWEKFLTQTKVKRSVKHVPVLMGAAGITAGLFGVMTLLIADEFRPQDTIEIADFDFNAKPIELPIKIDRRPPKLLEPIEIPPPPPHVEIPTTQLPHEPIVTTSTPADAFDPTTLTIPANYKIQAADGDPQPISRIGPVMPSRADRSGHCRISFDISPDGKPYNIRARTCSQSHFERPATRSVEKWTYRPEIRDGLPVTRTGLETLIRFNLLDERGTLIPE